MSPTRGNPLSTKYFATLASMVTLNLPHRLNESMIGYWKQNGRELKEGLSSLLNRESVEFSLNKTAMIVESDQFKPSAEHEYWYSNNRDKVCLTPEYLKEFHGVTSSCGGTINSIRFSAHQLEQPHFKMVPDELIRSEIGEQAWVESNLLRQILPYVLEKLPVDGYGVMFTRVVFYVRNFGETFAVSLFRHQLNAHGEPKKFMWVLDSHQNNRSSWPKGTIFMVRDSR